MTRRAEAPLWVDLTFGLGFTLKAVAIYFLVGVIWGSGQTDDWTLMGRFLITGAGIGIGAMISRWAWGKRVSFLYGKGRSR